MTEIFLYTCAVAEALHCFGESETINMQPSPSMSKRSCWLARESREQLRAPRRGGCEGQHPSNPPRKGRFLEHNELRVMKRGRTSNSDGGRRGEGVHRMLQCVKHTRYW
jgi:hypothetical protein